MKYYSVDLKGIHDLLIKNAKSKLFGAKKVQIYRKDTDRAGVIYIYQWKWYTNAHMLSTK